MMIRIVCEFHDLFGGSRDVSRLIYLLATIAFRCYHR